MNIGKKKMILIGLLCCGVIVTTAVIFQPGQTNANRAGYTIIWKGVFHYTNGNIEETYSETRFVSSSSDWHSIKLYTDGRTLESFAEVGRGVFLIKPEEMNMQFLSHHSSKKPVDPEIYRHSANYVRTEEVLGYTAYVLSETKGNVSIERWIAPDLSGDMIKHVYRNKTKEGTFMRVLEPISITLGEPAPELMTHQELPIDFTIYNQKHTEVSPTQQ